MLDEQALLQALNSTPVTDGHRQDLWEDDREIARWARDHDGDVTGPEEYGWLRLARDALQESEIGNASESESESESESGPGPGPGPESDLRRVLAGVRRVPVVSVSVSASASGVEWELEVPPERRLAVELVLAWADVKERLPGRLRPCGNPECRLFLLDRSRANTARWCSMKTCGNRLKARRHQARAREAS